MCTSKTFWPQWVETAVSCHTDFFSDILPIMWCGVGMVVDTFSVWLMGTWLGDIFSLGLVGYFMWLEVASAYISGFQEYSCSLFVLNFEFIFYILFLEDLPNWKSSGPHETCSVFLVSCLAVKSCEVYLATSRTKIHDFLVTSMTNFYFPKYVRLIGLTSSSWNLSMCNWPPTSTLWAQCATNSCSETGLFPLFSTHIIFVYSSLFASILLRSKWFLSLFSCHLVVLSPVYRLTYFGFTSYKCKLDYVCLWLHCPSFHIGYRGRV